RRRRIEDIKKEWFETRKPFIFVVDDNFFGVGEKHATWAKQLLREIIAEGRRRNPLARALARWPRLRKLLGYSPKMWVSQTTINMGDDDEGLSLAHEAGCRGMFVGFETFNPANLKDYHKGVNRKNLSRYRVLVNGFHESAIGVFGGFIVGADHDDENTTA